jgi:hypothetical protein
MKLLIQDIINNKEKNNDGSNNKYVNDEYEDKTEGTVRIIGMKNIE